MGSTSGPLTLPVCSCSVLGMELNYKVVEVAPSGDRIIATADNLAVARAAFDTAVSLWPGSSIELRQKARVIVQSKRENQN
jgi:hypothetical protein